MTMIEKIKCFIMSFLILYFIFCFDNNIIYYYNDDDVVMVVFDYVVNR
jgi:hypothetical protein